MRQCMSTQEGFGEETGKCIHVNGEEGTYNGPERRRTDFEDERSKLLYDAAHLAMTAKEMSERKGKFVHPNTLIRRTDDDAKSLMGAIRLKVLRYVYFDADDPDLKKIR